MIRGQNAYLESDVLADRAAVLRAVADWMDRKISFRSDELRAAADELGNVRGKLHAVAKP